MAFTNSKMVVCTKLSPNHSGQRTHSIDRISPHCVVGQVTAESLGNIFAKSSYKASSNYGIDKNGRVGMYVEEKNRSWCTSSNANDQRAVTIECASDTASPYRMNDAVYETLIRLCIDICRRNGKKKLIWFGDKNKSLNYNPKSDEMVITVHRWFANKSCPGDWLYSRLGDLAKKVTAQLDGNAAVGLSVGDRGTEVEEMQRMLIACGYSCGDCGVDGSFGNDTLVALQAFKKDAGLASEGVFDDEAKKALYKLCEEKKPAGTSTQATELKDLSNEEVIRKVGPLFTADQKKTGVLASVSLAQFILESGYGKSELAQQANNCFGMKKSLSGNTWAGSVWDGKSIYIKKTKEQRSWGTETVTAEFRKYTCIEDSIADHSAYLTGARKGSALRYEGLKGCTDYRKAAQIIKNGGYATSAAYVEKLCSIIEEWHLTQYDADAAPVEEEKPAAVKLPYLIRVSKRIDIKRSASASAATARKCPVGIYTIVAEQNGYGKLKSGAGWVRLSEVRKI